MSVSSRFKLASDSKPVSAASIKLIDSKRTQTQLIDPASNGIAEFYGVAPGQVKVETTYRLMGKTSAPNKVSYELGLKRDAAEPTIAVALPENVETISAKEEPKAKKTAEGEPEAEGGARVKLSQPSRIGSIFVTLLVLALGGAVVYFAILYMRRNEPAVKAQLKKLGVQIPEPPDPADATPPPAVPVAPQPPQKIILDDGASIAPVASMTATVAPYASAACATSIGCR